LGITRVVSRLISDGNGSRSTPYFLSWSSRSDRENGYTLGVPVVQDLKTATEEAEKLAQESKQARQAAEELNRKSQAAWEAVEKLQAQNPAGAVRTLSKS